MENVEPVPPPSRHWETWTHLAHRYVLPVAAGTVLTFGAALLFDYQAAVAAYVPALLLGVGVAALSTSFAFLASRHRPVAPSAPKPAAVPRRSAPSPPRPVRNPGPVAPASAPKSLARRPDGAGRSPWSATLTTSSPGDLLWHEWLPTEIDHLGTEIVGPVPETFYLDPIPGAAQPFEYRERDLVRIDPPPPPFVVPNPVGTGFPTMVDDWTAGSVGISPFVPTAVEFEALTPTPPHLRPSFGAPPSTRPPTPARSLASRAQDSCSSCLVTLEATRWQPCPGCYLPICPDCAIDSLASYGATGCSACAQGRSMTN